MSLNIKVKVKGVERWEDAIHLNGDVNIAEGAILLIEPGTTINREPDCQIIVNGMLIAKGTSHQKIHFKQVCSPNKSQIQDVPFIRTHGQSAMLHIEHCMFH